MRNGVGVASVVELTEKLAIRDLLRGVEGAQLEERAQERRLANAFHLEDILHDRWLDDGGAHIVEPACLFSLLGV